jgi:hypothetical protein
MADRTAWGLTEREREVMALAKRRIAAKTGICRDGEAATRSCHPQGAGTIAGASREDGEQAPISIPPKPFDKVLVI